MKVFAVLVVAVLGSVLGAVVVSNRAAPAPAPAPAKSTPVWEYKVLVQPHAEADLQKALNDLGADGWELTGTTGEVAPPSKGATPLSRATVRLILKRAKG